MKWFLLPFVISFVGCVATGTKTPRSLPASLESYFRPCGPLSGAMVVNASDDGNLIGSSEMEWETTKHGWNIGLSNAAGISIGTLVQTKRSIKVTGELRGRLPTLSVNEDGFLEVDGNYIGIKAHEIPCFFASALPRAWTPHVYLVEGNLDTEFKIFIDDDDREIVVRTKNLGDVENQQICADISWRNRLIFKSTIKWCVEDKGLLKGELSGLNELTVKWVRFED